MGIQDIPEVDDEALIKDKNGGTVPELILRG